MNFNKESKSRNFLGERVGARECSLLVDIDRMTKNPNPGFFSGGGGKLDGDRGQGNM